MSIDSIHGTLSAVGTLTGSLAAAGSLDGDLSVPCYMAPPYEGRYEITPSAETQLLDTKNKIMKASIVINPIPSNYGLITWNGAVLTVS